MIRACAPVALLLSLTASGNQTREIALDGLNLGRSEVLAKLKVGLSARDADALVRYTLLHWPGSKNYCGMRALSPEQQPRTVGEAIEFTIHFDRAIAEKRANEDREAIAGTSVLSDKQLVDKIDHATLQRDILLARPGGAEPNSPDLLVINRELERLRQMRGALQNPLERDAS